MNTTLPGTIMPMPRPVGDGRYFAHLVSPSVIRMPSTEPITRNISEYFGSASKPLDSTSAKPAIRPRSATTSPLIAADAVRRLLYSGYVNATAAAPIGAAISCE